jgi:NADH dehydrogenase
MIKGRKPQRFHYWDKGSLGNNWAEQSGRRSKIHAFERACRVAGVVVCAHLFLIGFRNRLLVLFQWAWAYFTFR